MEKRQFTHAQDMSCLRQNFNILFVHIVNPSSGENNQGLNFLLLRQIRVGNLNSEKNQRTEDLAS